MMGATLAELLKAAGKARRAENLKKGEDSPKVSFDTIGNSNAAEDESSQERTCGS